MKRFLSLMLFFLATWHWPAVADEPGEAAVDASVQEPAAPPATTGGGAVYGPLKAAETLWSIARQVRGDATMYQALLALYKANPEVFAGRMDRGVLPGATLRVPDAAAMRATAPEAAKAEVDRLRGESPGTAQPAPTALARAATTAPTPSLPPPLPPPPLTETATPPPEAAAALPETEAPPQQPTPATAPPPADGGKRIVVSLSAQKAYAYEGEVLVHSSDISSGKQSTPTVTGTFAIYYKARQQRMHGPGYDAPHVPYAMFFYKSYALHGAPWRHKFGTPLSHGCVNMSTAEAEWAFNWAPVGTTVVVQQ